MFEYPVYVRMTTEDERPYLENRSAAEAVIDVLIDAQNQGWLRLHGFVVLPDAVEMVISPIRQNVSGVIAHLQAETTPVLGVLLPDAVVIWSQHVTHTPVMTQHALDARLAMLQLSPVAHAVSEVAEDYPFASANSRYSEHVTHYTGFARMLPLDRHALETGELHIVSLPDRDRRTGS